MATKREVFLFDLCTRKETENRQLQSDITEQELIIKQMKEDGEFWFCRQDGAWDSSDIERHNKLMNELGEKQ